MNMKTFQTLDWNFPLPEPGTGVRLGNGSLGLMVWGVERLCVTVSRNGFWDRRGGAVPRVGATFQELKRLLQAGETEAAGQLFTEETTGDKPRPTQLPCARLELIVEGWKPERAELDYLTGTLKVHMAHADGRQSSVVIRNARDTDIAWIECDSALGPVTVATVPMWNFLGPDLAKIGCQPPVVWDEKTRGGVCQELPEDPALALAWEWQERRLVLALALGEDPRAEAEALAQTREIDALAQKSLAWWEQYWRDMPKLTLPDEQLQHVYLHSVFQQAGLTPAEGVAATLVGPWMEEMYPIPWSNDYHFNINLQMVYWPCLLTNRTDHLWPLWELVRQWFPQLRQNAQRFFECEDAMMLPHAVNDLGQTVDNFWMGMIDHGCTAWVAQLAWLHYRYSMDERVLREIAWPLLTGTFNGYWAMAEEVEENGRRRLSLPITVSPEYTPPGRRAWGRDASFQLAAWHMVTDILFQAAPILGEKPDPRWTRVVEELPPYSTVEGAAVWDGNQKVRHLAMWEGQDLDQSHRHHSCLAGIYPFATIDPMAPENRQIILDTLQHWICTGTGFWAGWSLPWAAALIARCDLPDAGIAWLHWWRIVYNNIGHGSDHNGDFAGCTIAGRGYILPLDPNARYRPIIQLDGAMGAITAILELLVQCRRNTIVVLPRISHRWRAFSFDGIRTEGAFLVGATVEDNRAVEIRITSLAGQPLRLRHPLGSSYQLDGQPREGDLLEIATSSGQRLVLSRTVT
jgi:alpha-L-fucosidase 2